MTDREKLVELLDYIGNSQEFSCYDLYDMSDAAEPIADFLIQKGVTVREWISVKDELPKSEVLAANFAPGTHGYKEHIIGFISGERCTDSGGCVAENDYEILHDVTHWMPLPEAPKEES